MSFRYAPFRNYIMTDRTLKPNNLSLKTWYSITTGFYLIISTHNDIVTNVSNWQAFDQTAMSSNHRDFYGGTQVVCVSVEIFRFSKGYQLQVHYRYSWIDRCSTRELSEEIKIWYRKLKLEKHLRNGAIAWNDKILHV